MIHSLIKAVYSSMKKIIQDGGVSIAFPESFQIHLADFERIGRLIAVFQKDTNTRQLVKIQGWGTVLRATPEIEHMVGEIETTPFDQVVAA